MALDRHRRRSGSATAARWLAVGATCAVLTATLVWGAGAHAAAPEPEEDVTVTVEVTDGVEPSPSPTRNPGPPTTVPGPPFTPPGPPSFPGAPQAPVTAQVIQATIPDPAAADAALGDDAVSAGGTLTMSGLTAEAAPSFDIGNGSLTLDFVVRNTSTESVSASARFWVDNVFGMRLADVADVRVDSLEPDETRRVLVRIDGLGQHILLRTYVTLTPPQTVDGVELAAMTRDTTILVPPLFSLSLASGIGALSGLAWWALRRRGFGLPFRRLGA